MLQRRTFLAGLTAIAAGPASAQAPQGGMTQAETQYITSTLKAGSLSLATSRLALKQAQEPKLKEFAQFEVAEQETVADVLKSLQSGSVSGSVKPPSDSELQQNLDQEGQQLLRSLQSAQAGATFDRDYLKAQVDGHNKLLRIQEDYLKSGRDLGAVNTAKLARGQIKEHLQLLADIQGQAGTGTTGRGRRRD
jgi:putative membrane protein